MLCQKETKSYLWVASAKMTRIFKQPKNWLRTGSVQKRRHRKGSLPPNLLLNGLVKDWAETGHLALSIQSLERKDLTGKSSYRKRVCCLPVRLPTMAFRGTLGREGMGEGWAAALSLSPTLPCFRASQSPLDFKWSLLWAESFVVIHLIAENSMFFLFFLKCSQS